MIVERLLVTALVILLAVAAYLALQYTQRRRLTLSAASQPRLLYFRSQDCAGCAAQSSYVGQVASRLDKAIQVEQIDTDNEPEKASTFGILTLPTTLIVDRTGAVRHINYGVTPASKLTRQLEGIL